MGAIQKFVGAKSLFGGGGGNKTTPDTFFTEDNVEVILAVSEGPIKGLADNSPSSFLVADTPLVDSTGKPNIGKFDLRFYKGNNPGGVIQPRLGGSGASINVGVELASNTSVTRTSVRPNIDFLELRIAINRLLTVTDKGQFRAQCQFRVEVKESSASTWQFAYNGTLPPAYEDLFGVDRYTNAGAPVGQLTNPAYRQTLVQATTPAAPAQPNAIWFHSGQNNRPYSWTGSSWIQTVGATLITNDGPYHYWAWTDLGNTIRAFIGWVDKLAPRPGRLHDIWVAPAGTLDQVGAVAYTWNGSAWTNQMDWGVPPTVLPGVIGINEKISSTAVKELRIPVNRIAGTYDIRVTKLSPENTTKYFCDITWESFQEINVDPLEFDDLALAHLVVKASNQFSSIPAFTPICEGRIVRVPTNYDPVNRTYSGIWDGMFKNEYTNNGAWIAYDLVMNDRYGMNAYYPVTLDKWATYEFGKHWDDIGFEFNEQITEPRDLTEAIDFICGIAGGRFVDQGDGFATILFDYDDKPAVKLFTPENVVDGVFVYGFTDVTSRKNDITVSFINENYGWIEDRRRVFNASDISQNGRNPEEFIAVGCIDEVEALKRATLRLIVSQTETGVVNFRTNRYGLYLNIYDYVLIADEDSDFGISGRIKSVANNTTIRLRDLIYFEAGLDYIIKFTTPDGIIERELVTSSGATRTLTLATPLATTLPEFCSFSIECEGSVGIPKCYRVTSIEEAEGDPDNVSVTVLEVNRNKWAIVKGEVTAPNVQHSGQVGRNVDPVSNIYVEGQTTDSGQHNIYFRWDASPSKLLRIYRIYASINGGAVFTYGETRETFFTIENAQPATYNISVVAVSMENRESQPVSFQHEVLGAIRPVLPPDNLTLINGFDPNTFQSPNPHFKWDESLDPFLDKYVVRIINNSTQMVLRTVETTIQEFIYELPMNVADFGGAGSRTFLFEVRALDVLGGYSPPLQLLVANPVPAVVVPTISNGVRILFVQWTPPAGVSDIIGARVWVSLTNNFDPNVVLPVYEGPEQLISIPVLTEDTYYVRIALYDNFGKTGLNISPQYSHNLVDPDIIDQTVPPVPTGLSFTTGVETLPSGELNTWLQATWSASSGAATYDIEIKQGVGSYIGARVGNTSYRWNGLLPNTVYTARVRATSQFGFSSAYSSETNTTTTQKTTAPAAPTGLTATASLKSAFLQWVLPADTDVEVVNVYRNTLNDSGTATLIGSSKGIAFTDTGLTTATPYFYWVRAVNTSGILSAFSTGVGVTPGVVANGDIAVNSLNGDRVQAATLAGDRLIVNTALPATITVGVTGVTIGTIESRAADPAARVNAAATTIDPGKILISGGTTLASWRNGSDNTKIEGGSIAANTIAANTLFVGARGLTIAGLQFSYNKTTNVLSWTAGAITYVNNAGSTVTVAVSSGTATWTTGTLYVAWQQGDSTLVSSTTPYSAATHVMLATYRGSNDLNANYSRTIIDGANILTGSIVANNIAAGAIESAAIAAGAVIAGKIAADAVTATEINVGTLDAISADVGEITAGILKSPGADPKVYIDLNAGTLKSIDGEFSGKLGAVELGLAENMILKRGAKILNGQWPPWGVNYVRIGTSGFSVVGIGEDQINGGGNLGSYYFTGERTLSEPYAINGTTTTTTTWIMPDGVIRETANLTVTPTGSSTPRSFFHPFDWNPSFYGITFPYKIWIPSIGYDRDFVVPDGCIKLAAKCWGAAGGTTSTSNLPGGAGGYVAGTIAVTPGDKIRVQVGAGGSAGSCFELASGPLYQGINRGYAGAGVGAFARPAEASGGGRTMISKINADGSLTPLFIAAGGGSSEPGVAGSPGGVNGLYPSYNEDWTAGGRGASCTATNQAGGGGGWRGGLRTQGGANYIDAAATSTTNLSGSTHTPPNTSDADYIEFTTRTLAEYAPGRAFGLNNRGTIIHTRNSVTNSRYGNGGLAVIELLNI